MAFAFCDRRGVIEIAAYTPAGMFPLGKGKGARLIDAIQGIARLAYDGRTWLVPGIPEAETNEEAVEAAKRFRDRVSDRLKKGGA